MSDFLEDHWFLSVASASNLLQCIDLAEVHEDSDVSLKIEGIFEVFPD